MFGNWLQIVTLKKSVEQVAGENPTVKSGLIQFLVAILITGILGVLLLAFSYNQIIDYFDAIILEAPELSEYLLQQMNMIPEPTAMNLTIQFVQSLATNFIGLFVIVGIIHGLSKVLGGQGTFKQLLSVTAVLAAAVFGTLLALLSLLMVLSALAGAFLIVSAILGFVSLAVMLFLWYLAIKAVSVVEKFSMGKSFGITLVPVIIYLVFTIAIVFISIASMFA